MQPAAMPTAMEMAIWKNFMTMPRTASGIWAYSTRPKTGSSAPYFMHIFWTAAMDATREIWGRKLVTPRLRNFFTSLPRSPKLPLPSRTARMWHRYQTERAAVRSWPSTVAMAAPAIPIFRGKMKMGSRTTFVSAPATVAHMANLGLPSERMIGFMAWPNM